MQHMNSNIKILGIIPARGGSRGIPKKNIARLGGRPLIYYTIQAAKKSKMLDSFIVSTDDPKIRAVAESFGADAPFLRPKQYAQNNSTDIQFLKHAVAWLEKHRGWRPEIVVVLVPTSPTRTAKDIDAVLKFMINNRCDSVRTIFDPSPYNPFKMWVLLDAKKGIMKPLLPTKDYNKIGTDVPRQLLPNYYLQIGLVHATKTKFIKQGKVWGPDVRGFIVSADKMVDIDTPRDIKKAEAVMKNLKLL